MGQALVSQQFRESIAGSFLGFALSALGIAVFAYAVGQQAPVEAIKAQTLNPQFLTLSQTAMPKYEASFGKDCAAGPVGVYVLGKGSTSLDVLSIPSDKCKATRVTDGSDLRRDPNDRQPLTGPESSPSSSLGLSVDGATGFRQP